MPELVSVSTCTIDGTAKAQQRRLFSSASSARCDDTPHRTTPRRTTNRNNDKTATGDTAALQLQLHRTQNLRTRYDRQTYFERCLDLVGERFPPNALPALSSSGWIARLDHEPCNVAMEFYIVISARRTMCEKVLGSFGSCLAEYFDLCEPRRAEKFAWCEYENGYEE